MRILIVADVYPPEVSSAASLMQELAAGLAARGHRVTVATAYPRLSAKEFPNAQGLPEQSFEEGVEVLRIKTLQHRKVPYVIRGIAQLMMPAIFWRHIRPHLESESLDAVIVYSPPLPLGLLGRRIKQASGAKFLLNIQDLFPQNAIDLGVLRNPLLIKFFEAIERRVYAAADVITFHSEGGRRFLVEKKGVPESKIVTLHNWIDLSPFHGQSGRTTFRRPWGFSDKFTFLFAGTFGPAQGMDFLIEVARRTADVPEIVYLLVGDGKEKERIETMAKQYGLTNVLFRPFISKEDYPALVREVDGGLVCLSPMNKTPFVPGKFLGYMAAAKPVLAFLNKESDGFALMAEAKCGYAAVSDDAARAAELVKKMYQEKDQLAPMGQNGLEYVKRNLSLEVVLGKFEELLKR